MVKKCLPGVICFDISTMWMYAALAVVITSVFFYLRQNTAPEQKVIVVHQQQGPIMMPQQQQQVVNDTDVRPPIRSYNRGRRGAVQQIGILTAEGGSSSAASPDRTILPLFGRELDVRRSRWNYYTRTDGFNPVQVPVRVGNRLCDDDTNGCNEVFSDDTVHVPALGRSFKASVYKVVF